MPQVVVSEQTIRDMNLDKFLRHDGNELVDFPLFESDNTWTGEQTFNDDIYLADTKSLKWVGEPTTMITGSGGSVLILSDTSDPHFINLTGHDLLTSFTGACTIECDEDLLLKTDGLSSSATLRTGSSGEINLNLGAVSYLNIDTSAITALITIDAGGDPAIDASTTTVCPNLNAELWNGQENLIVSPADDEVLKYDSASGKWKNATLGELATGPMQSLSGWEIYEDFLGKAKFSAYLTFIRTANATAASYPPSGFGGEENHPGVFRFKSSQGDETGYGGFLGSNIITIQGGEHLRFVLKINSLATDHEFYCGFGNNSGGALPTQGFYFGYQTWATPSANWLYGDGAGSSLSNFAQSTDWVLLELVVNDAGTQCEFFINGTSRGTKSTMPTTANMRIFAWIRNGNGDTTARAIDVDLVHGWNDKLDGQRYD